ncbi:MAG TPA: hypothetical protein VK578_21470 [Edaphobacter sp.]|nr:hypothetical protein [Edaphobacter sp.]
MSKAVRRKRQAVRLLHQSVKKFSAIICKGSYQTGADSTIATFERYVKRLSGMTDGSVPDVEFWSLHQKVYLRLLKHTLKIRG